MSTIKKNVRKSGLYPWGEGMPFGEYASFIDRVEGLVKEGKTKKQMLEIVNETLPKEYRMNLTEFRVARRKACYNRKLDNPKIHDSMGTRDKIGEVLSVELNDKHMIAVNNAAQKLGVARCLVDCACYDLEHIGSAIRYGIDKHDGTGGQTVLALPKYPKDYALAHLDEIKELDSHQLA